MAQPSPIALLALLTLSGAAGAAGAAVCEARSTAVAPTVVELYTSEGCSSCPPADRWLSTLKGRSDVLPLAFHVTYWDRLGWADRFATPEATARQHELARLAGSSTVYTPQVVAGGRDWRDWRDWPKLPKSGAADASSAINVTLAREGDTVTATITANQSGSTRLAGSMSGYWAVLEDGHQSKVKSGENAGETLKHDHVVRLYKPVPAWASADGGKAMLTVSRGVAEFPRRVVFVVTDASGQRPLQAVALSC